jgi:hypothetical protein
LEISIISLDLSFDKTYIWNSSKSIDMMNCIKLPTFKNTYFWELNKFFKIEKLLFNLKISNKLRNEYKFTLFSSSFIASVVSILKPNCSYLWLSDIYTLHLQNSFQLLRHLLSFLVSDYYCSPNNFLNWSFLLYSRHSFITKLYSCISVHLPIMIVLQIRTDFYNFIAYFLSFHNIIGWLYFCNYFLFRKSYIYCFYSFLIFDE